MTQSIASLALFAAFTTACGFQIDDAEEFREAIPESQAVALKGPESEDGGTTRTQSAAPSRMLAAGEPWAEGPWAKWYGFTRNVRDGVNHVTGDVLGAVWYIVHTRPTSRSENQAIWGPHTDALSPVTWRFRVERVGPHEYDYLLEGRPKAASSEADFKTLLSGKGWGRQDARHGDGHFEIDLDVARELDPFKHQDDSGTVRIEHDLPETITRDAFAMPRSVIADIRPSITTEWVTITSRTNQDGTGNIVVDAYVDIDDSHATAIEDLQILSRWAATGEGRADISLAGGDIPASAGTVTATECWGRDFYQVYYSDSVNFEPSQGDASACVYAQPMEL